jgi:AcrR family transcriptional regulator
MERVGNLGMHAPAKPRSSAADETKAKILQAAQRAFSRKGYAQTGLREIAASADVAPSLVIKYFQSKANLFEQALIKALDLAMEFDFSRRHFGERFVQVTGDPDVEIVLPAMVALSIGDEKAGQIAARVAETHIISPTAKEIGPPDARAKAAAILMLSTGLTIYSRYLRVENSEKVGARTRKLIAKALQMIIDDS